LSRIADYRAHLRSLKDWAPFLHAESRLPGPRGNLELLAAVADEGETELFLSLIDENPPHLAPTNTSGEFVATCGATGLGARIAAGEETLWPRLRALASDPRWRVREGVAMGLQRIGDVDMGGLLTEMRAWVGGNAFERRAAVAGLCEPRLLREAAAARAVLDLLDRVTASLLEESDRRREDVRVLRKALGYGWSVAIVASAPEGKARLERWAASDDTDVRWIVRENLRKARLERMDGAWVAGLRARSG
jgi:hypothetical protein